MANLVSAVATRGEEGVSVDAVCRWYMETFLGLGLQSARITVKEAEIMGLIRKDEGQVFITEKGRERTTAQAKAAKKANPAPA